MQRSPDSTRRRVVRVVTFALATLGPMGVVTGTANAQAVASPARPTSEVALLSETHALLSRQGKRLQELGSGCTVRRPITGVRTASPSSAEP